MSFPKSDTIWMNGKLVPWDDAKIHVGSHVIHYGSAVFEGVRCYKTPEGPAVFRLDAHTERLFNSAKIYRMDIPIAADEFNAGDPRDDRAPTSSRPATSARSSTAATASSASTRFPCPVDMAIMVWDWGKYLGTEALEKGVDVCVSSWTRMAPNTLPAMAKSAANYMNSQLIKMEAVKGGYAEGIALDADGLRVRGQRREPLPREERHARSLRRSSRRSSPASRATACSPSPGASGIPVVRSGAPPGDALPRRRALLHRHGGRDHADPLGRQDRGRQRARAARSPRPCRRRSST